VSEASRGEVTDVTGSGRRNPAKNPAVQSAYPGNKMGKSIK
jgi:hypothetical protein